MIDYTSHQRYIENQFYNHFIMTNKLLILLLSLFVCQFNAQAQVTQNTNLYELADPDQLNVSLLYGNQKSNFKGSPFYNEGWKTGTVTVNDGIEYKDIQLRFNVYNDELWYKKTEENIIVINRVNVKAFRWKDENGMAHFEKCFIQKKPYYMEIIYADQHFQIYKMLTKKFIKKDNTSSNSYNSDQKDQYVWGKSALYHRKNGRLLEIGSKDKEFFLLFGQQKSAIQKFAKSNKLKIKNKEDVKEMFTHYYTLIQ